ncbi:MAG: DedA family protein [Gammaproteobacteria bacterium]|nr:DedA family protein [Gammaproteobacteria bacterium]
MQSDLWILFGSAFVSSTLLPGGSEALLLYYATRGEQDVLSLWLVATTGNTLGGMTSWGVGRIIQWRFPGKRLQDDKHRRALERVEKWGSPFLLLSWLPIIGDPLCVAAGWLKVNAIKALIFIAIGKAGRYAFLLLLT